jgi:protein-tyrosine phosphatase
MPFTTWSGRMVAEVLEIQSRRNTKVLLAHIERYLSMQKPDVWQKLLAEGVKMQCNAEFFLDWRTKRKALRMLKEGKIHFIGSDCHNLTSRPPKIGDAMAVIDQALGPVGRQILTQKAAKQLIETEAH